MLLLAFSVSFFSSCGDKKVKWVSTSFAGNCECFEILMESKITICLHPIKYLTFIQISIHADDENLRKTFLAAKNC
jgi:hypothetical protein